MAAGIKIQPCKTKLFQSEVEYLGHKISKGGVLMIPEYVQKIKELVSTEEWQGGSYILSICFLSIAPSSFIPQYSALTNRLNGIKKAEKFLWNEEIGRDLAS